MVGELDTDLLPLGRGGGEEGEEFLGRYWEVNVRATIRMPICMRMGQEPRVNVE